MRGHIVKKGARYYPVVELGHQAVHRCRGCHKRAGWVNDGRLNACPRCSGTLEELEERRQQWHEGHKRRKDAQQALTTLLASEDAGAYVAPMRQTLAEFLRDEWLPSLAADVRPSTLLSYRGHVDNHIVRHLGSAQLQKMGPAQINAFYAKLSASGLSPSTVRRVHATLHRALRDAVAWNRLARNPATQANPPKISADSVEKAQMKAWTAQELRAFLDSARDDRLYPLWLLYATTGLRRGEALGLRPEDVDLAQGRIAIRQALIAVNHVVQISKPKRSRSRRSVPLEASTVAALKAHNKRRAEERLAWGPGFDDCGLFFARENGTVLHPDAVSKTFDRLVRGSGLPRIRLHDLRHTFATLALSANLHPKAVSEILGHASVSITLDVYSHAIPSMQEEAAARVAALIFGADPAR